MRHDWIFDVLRDLRAYAQSNGLPALALKADEAMRVARAEVAASPAAPHPGLHPPSHGHGEGLARETVEGDESTPGPKPRPAPRRPH